MLIRLLLLLLSVCGETRALRVSRIVMGGGIVQPRPAAPFEVESAKLAAPTLPPGSAIPKLVVLDLDNTVWTPELYTLRQLDNYASAGPPGPQAGKDVWLIDGAAAALYELATCPLWKDTRVAVASRTNKGAWAHQLLSTFEIPGCPGRSIASLLTGGVEIFPGSKVKHFENLKRSTGIGYEEMLFFDDSADGRYGNCAPIAKQGVLSAHCPQGLTASVWHNAVKAFAQRSAEGAPLGVVLRPDGSSSGGGGGGGGGSGGSTAGLSSARVVKYLSDKGFGFVQVDGSGEQVFFHKSKVSGGGGGLGRIVGMQAMVKVGKDRRGRPECVSVQIEGGGGSSSDGGSSSIDGDDAIVDGVTLPIFSMNMPFAGLLAYGVKTIESRSEQRASKRLTKRLTCLLPCLPCLLCCSLP